MHRFFLSSDISGRDLLVLEGGEANHATRVLRIRSGDKVEILNGRGTRCLCSVESATKQRLDLTVLDCSSQPKSLCEITLFQAVTKGKSMDTIIQKSTELGATRIQPLITERVEVKLDDRGCETRADKWGQISIEALKQCGSVWLPEVTQPVSLTNCLAGDSLPELSVVGALTESVTLPGQCLSNFEERNGRLPASIGIWIGPEGDFTTSELDAMSQRGVQPVTLGPQILRSGTAAIYCLSVFSHELQLRQQKGKPQRLD